MSDATYTASHKYTLKAIHFARLVKVRKTGCTSIHVLSASMTHETAYRAAQSVEYGEIDTTKPASVPAPIPAIASPADTMTGQAEWLGSQPTEAQML